MSDTNLCPCGSEKTLLQCCLPIIQGVQPANTAEELLRARYTAFTQGKIDFILDSHHSKTRHEVKREEIKDWALNSEWLGLKIIKVDSAQADQSEIIFTATYRTKEKAQNSAHPSIQEHSEKSFFEKEKGQWKFLDAHQIHIGPYRRSQPKIGRNELCSCGSNKKYKKCCGNQAATPF